MPVVAQGHRHRVWRLNDGGLAALGEDLPPCGGAGRRADGHRAVAGRDVGPLLRAAVCRYLRATSTNSDVYPFAPAAGRRGGEHLQQRRESSKGASLLQRHPPANVVLPNGLSLCPASCQLWRRSADRRLSPAVCRTSCADPCGVT